MSPRTPPPGWRERADAAVRRGERLDRFIPSALLDSPISRIGAAAATAFGFVWGTLWSTGRVERRGDLWVFRGMPNWTFGRGGVCVGSCFLTGDRDPGPRLIAHESAHAAQWRRYGLLMLPLYLIAGRDALRNRFEIMAGLVDGGYVSRSAED